MSHRVVKISAWTEDAGECPMCGFDSLRRTNGAYVNTHGTLKVFQRLDCGRCINDIREM